jgi:nucleotide-binding universal stress UspA family protein
VFQHILVPLDGSTLAEDVLEPVVTMASALGSQVTLLHVLEREAPTRVHGEAHITDAATGAHYLGQVADRIHGRVPDVQVHIHSRPIDDVAAAINAHAAEFGVDLVAMCKHGGSGLRQALMGGIALRILKGGGTAVLLRSKPQDTPQPYKLERLLVPLDLEHDHTAGLEVSARVATATGASIHLITAVATVSRAPRSAVPVSLSPRAEAAEIEMQIEDTDKYLGEQENELRRLGLNVSREVIRGEPVDSILGAAGRLSADLVVMTTHARSGVEGWYRGSTGFRVISRAHQTLLLLRDL